MCRTGDLSVVVVVSNPVSRLQQELPLRVVPPPANLSLDLVQGARIMAVGSDARLRALVQTGEQLQYSWSLPPGVITKTQIG